MTICAFAMDGYTPHIQGLPKVSWFVKLTLFNNRWFRGFCRQRVGASYCKIQKLLKNALRSEKLCKYCEIF